MYERWFSILILAGILMHVHSADTDDTEDRLLLNKEGKCPSDEWYSSGLSCYYLLGGELDFSEAMSACSDLDKGAHLAAFRDQTQYYHVHHIVGHENQHHEHPRSSGTWIGLMKDSDDEWKWTDGTALTYTDFWLPSARFTDGHCGYVPGNRVGYAVSTCEHKKLALCQMTPEEYTVGEQQRRLKDVFIVSVVVALVLVGGIAVLVIGVAKYCCKHSPRDKGYTIQKDQEGWM